MTSRDPFQPQPVCDCENTRAQLHPWQRPEDKKSRQPSTNVTHDSTHCFKGSLLCKSSHHWAAQSSAPLLSQVQQQNKPLRTTAWKVLPRGCRPALGSQSQAKAQVHCPGPPTPVACKHTYHHRKSCRLETTATSTETEVSLTTFQWRLLVCAGLS